LEGISLHEFINEIYYFNGLNYNNQK